MGKSRAKQRKQGDKWYYLAKESGYRSRSSFKLIQLNKKYHFLEKTKVLIDLCAAPGGWLQVASKYCMPGSLICGVDLVPIKPIPNVITFVEDISTDKCRGKLRHYLKTWKADTILHDGAPNVGVTWLHDAYSQTELVLTSLKIVAEFLIFNGTFVTKIFRSKDYNNLLWVLNQLFKKVEATKPPASRNVSAEIFIVCREYKAPDKIDPKFFNPKFVFEDLPDPTPDHQSRIFNPSKKRRQRDGYEEGNYTQHKTVSAEDFLMSNNPIEILSIANTISLDDRDLKKYQGIKDLDITTKEIIACCEDLRVLGKKDFRGLLKWRILAREKLGLTEKKETESMEKIEIEPLNEEEEIEAEMIRMNNEEVLRKKKEKRRMLELKKKSIRRMQLGMVEDMDIGLEQGDIVGEESVFRISSLKGLDHLEIENQGIDSISEDDVDTIKSSIVESEDSEHELDRLENELDKMYEHYRSKREKKKPKINDNFDDISDSQVDNVETNNVSENESDSSSEESEQYSQDELSRKSKLFFEKDVFKICSNSNFEDSNINEENMENNLSKITKSKTVLSSKTFNNGTLNNNTKVLSEESIKNNDAILPQKNKNKRKLEMDITTAEAMTLAQSIASRAKFKRDIVDDAYNKWAFQDNDNLPEWFLDDEKKHNKRNIPISKEAVMAIREKMKAINARPIKKILEAKARKRMKAMKKMKKIHEKANSIIKTNDMTEKEKSENVRKLFKKVVKSQHKNKVKVVVAKGVNKGIKGRPKGIKGRYKIVDPRMKKDLRAAKRMAKRRR